MDVVAEGDRSSFQRRTRARVVTQIAPSASERIALLPGATLCGHLSTDHRSLERWLQRVGEHEWMLRSLTLVALALLAPGSTAGPSPSPTWSWPVETPRVIVRQYIAPATPYSRGHRGVDLAAPGGILRAPADGVVHFVGFVVDRPVLSIRHPGGLISSYEPVQTSLSEGDAVARGDPIGTIEPGHCSQSCLHFGVRLHGEYVSPLLYLGGIEPSVLLPTRR